MVQLKRSIKFIFMATLALSAGFLASCSDDDDEVPVVKTELSTAVTAANLLLTTTFEGVAAGNYLKGSQAPLATIICLAVTATTP